MPNAKHFFTEAQQAEIIKSIRNAELQTSGELRVHIEEKCKVDAYSRGLEVFAKLKMHSTAERNGVLFYLAVDDKKFAIIADKGIHNKVPENFWDTIRQGMESEFSKGRFMEGLIQGIEQAAEKLKLFFPFNKNDQNELPNTISFKDE